MIESMKKYAIENDIPIIEDDMMLFLMDYIKTNNVKNILEIGSAIGYSALVMASVSNDIKVDTLERDKIRHDQAVLNIDYYKMNDNVTLYLADALEFDEKLLTKEYDLLFIDAAKAQSQKFFEKYATLLKENGTVIIDNINFHGFANGKRESNNRNTRQLVRKINSFKDWLATNKQYKSEYYDIGDGILLAKRND